MFNCKKKTEIFLLGLDCYLEEKCVRVCSNEGGSYDFCSEKNLFKLIGLSVRNCVYLPFK